jgi:thiol:disulfide interchange protein DsbA
MKFALPSLLLATALLAGCGADAPAPAPATAPTPAPSAAPAPAAPAPAASPATPVETAAPAAPTPVPAPDSDAAARPAPSAPSGPEPREGVDYTRIDPPVPLSPSPGKIEVVEAFAYTCGHCATLQPRVTAWEKTLPADVEFRYAPMAHGPSEQIARAFYAAEAMGERARTHEGLFKAIATERRLRSGSAEELADLYAELGVDRDALLATMQSFAVNAQIARNQKTVERWAIEGTPTFIINGRYKAVATDRGHDGLMSTVDHLVARERAAAAGTGGAP